MAVSCTLPFPPELDEGPWAQCQTSPAATCEKLGGVWFGVDGGIFVSSGCPPDDSKPLSRIHHVRLYECSPRYANDRLWAPRSLVQLSGVVQESCTLQFADRYLQPR